MKQLIVQKWKSVPNIVELAENWKSFLWYLQEIMSELDNNKWSMSSGRVVDWKDFLHENFFNATTRNFVKM